MSRTSLISIMTSVVLSVVFSVGSVSFFERHRETRVPEVIQARKIELVDATGNVRATLELFRPTKGDELPRLTFSDMRGDKVMELGLDQRGDGALSFSNDYWAEGAVILGHLQSVDDNSQSNSKAVEDRTGAWGLRVRGRDGKYIGLGIANSGVPFAPLPSTIDAQK
jgi:hypothetical protein